MIARGESLGARLDTCNNQSEVYMYTCSILDLHHILINTGSDGFNLHNMEFKFLRIEYSNSTLLHLCAHKYYAKCHLRLSTIEMLNKVFPTLL